MDHTLVEKFFQDKCTKEEAEQVVVYLNDHPEQLDAYLGEKDWAAFAGSHALQPAANKRVWESIKKERGLLPVKRIHAGAWWAAAAAVVVIAFSYAWYNRSATASQKQLAMHAVTTGSSAAGDTLITNTGKNVLALTLADGSLVKLEPGSRLQFQPAFTANKRWLRLTGTAFFDVAKDAARPFTVWAGGLTTTALGTSFSIRSSEAQQTVTVQLLTGKVVVQRPAVANAVFAAIYLAPGEELFYDLHRNRSLVKSSRPVVLPAPSPAAPIHSNSLVFNNQPLEKVFKRLEKQFDVSIEFDRKQVSDMYFSGSYTVKDSVGGILSTISLINNLHVQKAGNRYLVTP